MRIGAAFESAGVSIGLIRMPPNVAGTGSVICGSGPAKVRKAQH
jgi:hypothetical protein